MTFMHAVIVVILNLDAQQNQAVDLRGNQMHQLVTESSLNDPQQTGPVGQRAGETEEIQRPLMEASGTDPGPA